MPKCFCCRSAAADLTISGKWACAGCTQRAVKRAEAESRRVRLEREAAAWRARQVETIDSDGFPCWTDPVDGSTMRRPMTLLEYAAMAA
jgi:hypothetical protein